jgi:FtsP/CotA-like multicopper oxidase with cupredoxin domain
MTLPEDPPPLPLYLQKTLSAAKMQPEASAIAPDQTIIFNVANQADCAGKFQINGVPFGPAATPIVVPLGATQIWEVQNSSNAPHPFHIHVNPFVVIEKNGTRVPPEQQFFQDTVLIRPKQNGVNGSVKFITTFDDFDGEFVIHCHILIHEDWGMMRKVIVRGDGVGPCKVIP